MENYEGKFVFVSAIVTDEKHQSTYYDGEYICLRQCGNSITCVRGVVGYAGHETHNFLISRKGNSPYEVLESSEDDNAIRRWAEEQIAWADSVLKGGEKKQWIDSVYLGAKDAGKLALRALQRKNGDTTPTPSSPSNIAITIDGVPFKLVKA